MYPASAWSALGSGYHGHQRACDLIRREGLNLLGQRVDLAGEASMRASRSRLLISAVCPTSRTIRNFKGSQLVATHLKAEALKAVGPMAASFTAWRFGELAGFAKVARFAEMTCFVDLPCFDEPLKISDSQPASLTSIGRSTSAAIAAIMVRRRGQNLAAIPPRTLRLGD